VNPLLRPGSPIHDRVTKALRDLEADHVRYVPWQPYPKLGVAESEPPRNGKPSWDFSLLDPLTVDFLKATAGHSLILNFSTIPQVGVQDREGDPLSARPRASDLGLGAGDRIARSKHEGVGRLLCAASELV
jgi:hypothetical protein